MRRKITAMLSGIAILLGIAVIAQQPALAAELSDLLTDKAELEAKQRADWNEKAGISAQQQTTQAELQRLTAEENFWANLQKNEVALAAEARLRGENVVVFGITAAARNVDVGNKLRELRGELARLAARDAQLTAAINRSGNQIAALDAQIAEAERTIAYNRTPLQGDLANEQARLDNLKTQKATGDDAGQLGWDIENTQTRIEQINKAIDDYNRAQSAQGAAASGQSQGPYGAGAGTSGTGPQSQYPPGYGPYFGAPPGDGSRMPTHQQLQQGMQPRTPRGSSGGASGGSSAAGTTSAAPAAPSGATCGPASSCTCAGGGRGHIPCDKSMGACHCGGG